MTKQQRAERIQGLIAEAFAPEVDDNTLHVTVKAPSKDDLVIEGLLDKGGGHQMYFLLNLKKPDLVRQMHDRMMAEGDPDIPF